MMSLATFFSLIYAVRIASCKYNFLRGCKAILAFLIEVIIYFLLADKKTLGFLGSGVKIQHYLAVCYSSNFLNTSN